MAATVPYYDPMKAAVFLAPAKPAPAAEPESPDERKRKRGLKRMAKRGSSNREA